MKTFYAIALILCANVWVNAQQPADSTIVFAAPGSHWFYRNIISYFSPAENYTEITVKGDTTIQGKNCRILKKYGGGAFQDEFVYCSGDTVFRLADNDTFYILYNFGAQIGDSWVTRSELLEDETAQEEMTITVFNLSTVVINGHTLRVLYVKSDHPALSFGEFLQPNGLSRITERLGGPWYMFPYNYAYLDFGIKAGLRCYSDNFLGNYETGIAATCDAIISDVNDLGVASTIRLFPNPFSSQLTVLLEDNEPHNLLLYDILGKLVLEQTITNAATIETGKIPDGVYFYSVKSAMSTLKTGTIVKQEQDD